MQDMSLVMALPLNRIYHVLYVMENKVSVGMNKN